MITPAKIEQIKRALRNKARLLQKAGYDWTDGKGLITYHNEAGQVVTVERQIELLARLQLDLSPVPLVETPNKFTTKKRCNACGELKALCHFSPDKRNGLGVQGMCTQCRAGQERARYHKKWKRS